MDIGPLTSGRWVVIEVGDAQFAGPSQVPPFQLWNRLGEALGSGAASTEPGPQ